MSQTSFGGPAVDQTETLKPKHSQVAVLAAALAVAPLLPGLRRNGGSGLSAQSRRRRQLAVCGACCHLQI